MLRRDIDMAQRMTALGLGPSALFSQGLLTSALALALPLALIACGDDDGGEDASAPDVMETEDTSSTPDTNQPDVDDEDTEIEPPPPPVGGDFADLRVTDGESVWRMDGTPAADAARLTSLPGHNAFWFAWSVFQPGSEIWEGSPVREAQISGNDECGVPCEEIIPGCPGRDCIPPLDSPTMTTEVPSYLSPDDPVMGVITSEGPRAYPHNVLWWHEIVNEEVGGEAFTISYCPLTGSGLRYDRRGFVEGETVRLGVSGLLYNSNLVMWDRETESLWSQMRNESVRGDELGAPSPVQPVYEMTFRAWQQLHPDTLIVSAETGHSRDYTSYPYTRGGDYRTNDADTFRQTNPTPDDQFENKDMVFGLMLGDARRGYVWNSLRERVGSRGVVNDEVDGTPVAIVFDLDEFYVHAFERPSGAELTLESGE